MARLALADATRGMKRFYRQATADAQGIVRLDGRQVTTPGRRALAVPSPRLAAAIADEWNAQGERIDPRTMPLTALAYAAIDRIAPDREGFARGLAAYGESDLLCYRAERPARLVERQAAAWDPILDWARRRYGIALETACGVVHRPQPPGAAERLAAAVAERSAFALAGLAPLVTIGGSLVAALALAEGAIGRDAAWAAVTLDEAWQAERWGEDAEAAKALAARKAEFDAGARFLGLL